MRHAQLTPGMTVHHALSHWDFRDAPGRVGTVVSTDRLDRSRGMFARNDYAEVRDGDGNTVRVPYATRDPKGRYVAVRFSDGFRGGVRAVELSRLYTPEAAAARHEQEKAKRAVALDETQRMELYLARQSQRLGALGLEVPSYSNYARIVDALLDRIDALNGTLTDPLA